MDIRAMVSNAEHGHRVEIETNGRRQSLSIAPKSVGRGSSVNGGELLCAALATCFCNDLYREADKRGIVVRDVEVEVHGTFRGAGEPARLFTYAVRVRAEAPQAVIDDLVRASDALSEIQNTVRAGCIVRLVP